MAAGIQKLIKILKDAKDATPTQAVREREAQSSAVQWFPGVYLPGLICKDSGMYFWYTYQINPGDWVVNNEMVLTDEEFKEKYTIVQ